MFIMVFFVRTMLARRASFEVALFFMPEASKPLAGGRAQRIPPVTENPDTFIPEG